MGQPEAPPQQTSIGVAEGKINEPQQTSSERPYVPPEPSQEELHKKYDITKKDAVDHDTASRQYERYAVAAEAWRANYDAHPTNPKAREMAAKADEMAAKYFKDNVEPFDKKILGYNGQPNAYTRYEPGVDVKAVQAAALGAEAIHSPNGGVHAKHEYGTHEHDRIEVPTGDGGTRSYDLKSVGECQQDMGRAMARDKAAHTVEMNGKGRDTHNGR